MLCNSIVVVVTAVVFVLVVVMPIFRDINTLVPAILNEIHGCAAGAIAMAVLVPMLYVPGWGMQVHGSGTIRRWLDDHGLAVYQLRGRVTA